MDGVEVQCPYLGTGDGDELPAFMDPGGDSVVREIRSGTFAVDVTFGWFRARLGVGVRKRPIVMLGSLAALVMIRPGTHYS